ncbi:CamS family sex pheromone protein [Ornithinibacillus contaminans]|uniref:CamS family sex pheromone protein n=1 Tax=Ornithinibacillus contaminans TaxID=694055 RepID=UPI00064DF10D|nr:CamS family sex pheromone protein [Ornithinibacillus contaminans]
MKKLTIGLISILLLLTSCAPKIGEEEDELMPNEEEPTGQPSIVPTYKLSDEDYRVILPYRTSEARGVITNQLANRLDIDEMEEGLMRHSKEYFDPNKVYFEEGQYLTDETVYTWIDELNPVVEKGSEVEEYRENPRYLSHILEQNFLKRNDDNTVDLVGLSIGLALKSQYRFQTEVGGPYFYEDIKQADMLKKGQEIAQKVLERIRGMEGLADVPVMFAIYREEEVGSAVPGNFVAKTYVQDGDLSIDEWEAVKEDYILFPSSEAEKKYFDDAQIVKTFGIDIAEFFPNYVGYIGEGFYVNEELQKLTIEVPIEFKGKGEVIGFSQYTYGLVKDKFPNKYDIEIKISSSDKLEGLIYRESGEENPTVHIFD